MQKPYEIIAKVQEAFRGLPGKLGRITGKSDTWWRSHSYEPRNANPLSNGNPSPVTEYMAFCELYNAAEPDAGRMMNHRVHAELEARFAENDLTDTSQCDLHTEILDESCDVSKLFARIDLETASKPELLNFETECDEAIEAYHAAKSRARAIRRQMDMKRTNIQAVGK
jgi:hypothetical protein